MKNHKSFLVISYFPVIIYIYKLLKKGFIRRIVIEDILGIKKTRATEVINGMIEKKIIKLIGVGSQCKYILF